jgi:putative transposase
MKAIQGLAQEVKIRTACQAFDFPRASFYRWLKPEPEILKDRPAPPLALSPEEKQGVLAVLNSARFMDQAPREIYATLLDEAIYLCSVRTMYRILNSQKEVRERRDQLRHPNYQKPELLAMGPNQVWSWDITKLKGPAKWTYFYLYVILDIFSRYVVGWMVAHQESASLARKLIAQSCEKQAISPGQLTIHADRGPSMASKPVAFLLADMGITQTHSRPYVSDDNPFSESQFKTMKYRPDFPERFGSLEDARAFCYPFFDWYNNRHYHSGLCLLIPSDVHYGRAERIIKERQLVLEQAFDNHPNRFKGTKPKPLILPQAAWINKPLYCDRGLH